MISWPAPLGGFIPEPAGQEADHTKCTKCRENADGHRQPDAEMEAHEGHYGPGAHRPSKERKEQQEGPEGLEPYSGEGQHLEQRRKLQQKSADWRGELIDAQN